MSQPGQYPPAGPQPGQPMYPAGMHNIIKFLIFVLFCFVLYTTSWLAQLVGNQTAVQKLVVCSNPGQTTNHGLVT